MYLRVKDVWKRMRMKGIGTCVVEPLPSLFNKAAERDGIRLELDWGTDANQRQKKKQGEVSLAPSCAGYALISS